VENIRGYYDLLVWLTEENHIKENAMADEKTQNNDRTAEITPFPLY
jgi:membrane-bound lytic murein transglycosylase F